MGARCSQGCGGAGLAWMYRPRTAGRLRLQAASAGGGQGRGAPGLGGAPRKGRPHPYPEPRTGHTPKAQPNPCSRHSLTPARSPTEGPALGLCKDRVPPPPPPPAQVQEPRQGPKEVMGTLGAGEHRIQPHALWSHRLGKPDNAWRLAVWETESPSASQGRGPRASTAWPCLTDRTTWNASERRHLRPRRSPDMGGHSHGTRAGSAYAGSRLTHIKCWLHWPQPQIKDCICCVSPVSAQSNKSSLEFPSCPVPFVPLSNKYLLSERYVPGPKATL